MTLRDMKEGDTARIVRVRGSGPFRQRLMEMGFIPGETVVVERYAPLRDPIEFVIKQYHVSLRRVDAALIEVDSPNTEFETPAEPACPGRNRRRNRWGRR